MFGCCCVDEDVGVFKLDTGSTSDRLEYVTPTSEAADVQVITVNVDKSPKVDRLGVDLVIRKNVDYMTVKSVSQDGLLAEWNSKAKPHEQVRAGDRIFQVNGQKGTGEELTEVVKANDKLELKLQRLSG
eukprot:TRINITY_DN89102_c0_g1_i1.p1 TRINITY_DN89102_c0_g1~~TRINITY_DN89102_c0_g1_i1.p1  ORF type:complete len:136 (+),score=33.54 TRINITY_DN89102_c0_g1_i1:22-408(+)